MSAPKGFAFQSGSFSSIFNNELNNAQFYGEYISLNHGSCATQTTVPKNPLADIVAVDGYPLKDAQVFDKVIFVVKDGVVYKGQ